MAISCFDRNENILQLRNRVATIILPAPLLLQLHRSKPECEDEIGILLAKLSASHGAGSKPVDAWCVIEANKSEHIFVQALVPPARDHVLLEAVSEQFVPNWKQLMKSEASAMLRALGFEEPGPRSPNFWLEIPGADKPSTDLAARIAAVALYEVYRARKLADTNVKLSLPGESVVEFTLGSVGAGEAPSTKVPGGADATTASTKKSSAIPDLPGIKPAPPEAYGKAYVIGGVRSPKPLPKQPEDVLLMKRDDGKNIRDIRLLLNEDGSIEINTCDSGEAPEQFFGHEDYEWWVKIAQENISRLAAALLKEKFGERFDTSDAFKTFYTTAGVAKENKTRLAFALLKERFSGNFCATDEFGEICKAAGVPYEWSSYP